MHLRLSFIAGMTVLILAGAAQAQAPAGSTAVCKDGTYSSAATKRGACSGHKGVGQWLAGDAATPTKVQAAAAPAPAMTSAPVKQTPMAAPAPMKAQPTAAPAPAMAPAPMKQAPMAASAGTGGAGQVWVNTKSKVYHCQGDRYYGNTKAGSYMSEAAAVAAGDRPDHGKGCH